MKKKRLTGIYKIVNSMNSKVYIGKALNIGSRFKTHLDISKWKKEKKLYNAFLKYGIEKFTFSIIEICNECDLFNRESHFINLYDSYNNGYNMTDENHTPLTLENTLVTKKEVLNIRLKRYKKSDKNEVYKEYSYLSSSGFDKIWNYMTWKNIGQEYNTEEIRNYYKQLSYDVLKTIDRNKLSKEERIKIKVRKDNGEKIRNVFNNYSNIYSFSGFKKLWYRL